MTDRVAQETLPTLLAFNSIDQEFLKLFLSKTISHINAEVLRIKISYYLVCRPLFSPHISQILEGM